MLKLGILVSGGGTNLQAVIDSIENGMIKNASIETVVSSNEDAYALKRAKKHGISTCIISKKKYASRDEYDEALLKHMKAKNIDLIVMAGSLSIVGSNLINEFKNRIINVHPSLIPAFCGDGCYGLKVHEKALEYGVKITGATVHFVDEITDGGPIILQKAVKIYGDDTPETLQKRVMQEAEWEILPRAINLICNNRIEIVDRTVKEIE